MKKRKPRLPGVRAWAPQEPLRWAIEHYSKNRLDGERRYFEWDGARPCLFRTRREARQFAKEHYGYIAHRKDLRIEPHGWRMPAAVRVRVRIVRESELKRLLEEQE